MTIGTVEIIAIHGLREEQAAIGCVEKTVMDGCVEKTVMDGVAMVTTGNGNVPQTRHTLLCQGL